MKLHIVTICLNSLPWLAAQWTTLVKLDLDWHWHLVEGAAANVNCTKWCARIEPQYSTDGTSEFIRHLQANPRVSVYRRPMWDGKVSMFNEALATIKDECVLMQMDSDEIWTAQQIRDIMKLFAWKASHAMFYARMFVGPDIVVSTRNCWSNTKGQDWKRAWYFRPGNKFISHEPPLLDAESDRVIDYADTERAGLVFDHFAYAMEPQVRFKQTYYNYAGAVAGWRRLQANTQWPAKLKDYFPWVRDGAEAVRI